MSCYCWATGFAAGPTITRHWVEVLCLPGCFLKLKLHSVSDTWMFVHPSWALLKLDPDYRHLAPRNSFFTACQRAIVAFGSCRPLVVHLMCVDLPARCVRHHGHSICRAKPKGGICLLLQVSRYSLSASRSSNTSRVGRFTKHSIVLVGQPIPAVAGGAAM